MWKRERKLLQQNSINANKENLNYNRFKLCLTISHHCNNNKKISLTLSLKETRNMHTKLSSHHPYICLCCCFFFKEQIFSPLSLHLSLHFSSCRIGKNFPHFQFSIQIPTSGKQWKSVCVHIFCSIVMWWSIIIDKMSLQVFSSTWYLREKEKENKINWGKLLKDWNYSIYLENEFKFWICDIHFNNNNASTLEPVFSNTK